MAKAEASVEELVGMIEREELLLAAEQGLPTAQNNLAIFYERNEQLVEAANWYRKAANQGFANAQASLGVASRTIALIQNGIRCSWPQRSCGS
jgi:TPR repeat protein